MEVYFNDELLYTKHKDMCEAAKDLDTPYTCPVKAGRLGVNVAGILIVKDILLWCLEFSSKLWNRCIISSICYYIKSRQSST